MIFNTYSIGTKVFVSVVTFINMTTKNQEAEALCAQVAWFNFEAEGPF